jgi:hypothetical protein
MNQILTYVHNKEKRANTPFSIVKGKGIYKEQGKVIEMEDFEAMYPLPLIPGKKLENSDGTKNFLNDSI